MLTNEQMWGQDLSQIKDLEKTVIADLALICKEGAEKAYASVL